MPIPYERLKNALLAEKATLTEPLQQLSVVATDEGVKTALMDCGWIAAKRSMPLASRRFLTHLCV